MAKFTFNMPDIGEGIAEAEIVQWHKQVGDMISEDEEFVDMMTDKATVPMESPVNGKILEIAGGEGDMVSIGSMLVVIEVEGEVPEEVLEENEAVAEPTPAPAPKDDEVEERIEVETSDASDADEAIAVDPKPEPIPAPTPAPEPVTHAKVLATPAVRQRAKDLGVDLAQVKPAEDGRIRHGDLDQFLSYNSGYGAAAKARADEEKKVIGMRRRIAENMAASKRNIPHFSYVEECDVTALEELRAQLNAARGDKPKLTILPFLMRALVKAVADHPGMNATFDDEKGVVSHYEAVHIGIATQTPSGLTVPVVRHTETLGLWECADEVARVAEAARTGTAHPRVPLPRPARFDRPGRRGPRRGPGRRGWPPERRAAQQDPGAADNSRTSPPDGSHPAAPSAAAPTRPHATPTALRLRRRIPRYTNGSPTPPKNYVGSDCRARKRPLD